MFCEILGYVHAARAHAHCHKRAVIAPVVRRNHADVDVYVLRLDLVPDVAEFAEAAFDVLLDGFHLLLGIVGDVSRFILAALVLFAVLLVSEPVSVPVKEEPEFARRVAERLVAQLGLQVKTEYDHIKPSDISVARRVFEQRAVVELRLARRQPLARQLRQSGFVHAEYDRNHIVADRIAEAAIGRIL